MTARVKTQETLYLDRSPDRIDEEQCIIFGMKLGGYQSQNTGLALDLSRDEFGEAVEETYLYPREEVEKAKPKFNASKPVSIYVNHHRGKGGRPVRSLLGEVITGTMECRDDGYYGNVRYSPKNADAPLVIDAAKRFPRQLGCSPRYICLPKLIANRIHMTDLEPLSIDIVTEPATTAGLFEEKSDVSETTVENKPKKTIGLSEFVKGLPVKTPYRKALEDMLEDGTAAPDQQVATAPEKSPEATAKDAYIEAIAAKMKADATPDQLKEIAAILGMSENPLDDVGGGEEKSEEQKQKAAAQQAAERLDRIEAENALLRSGVSEPTTVMVRAYSSARTAEEKRELIDTFKRAAGSKTTQTSEGRPETSPPASSAETRDLTAFESAWDKQVKAEEEQLTQRGQRVA